MSPHITFYSINALNIFNYKIKINVKYLRCEQNFYLKTFLQEKLYLVIFIPETTIACSFNNKRENENGIQM